MSADHATQPLDLDAIRAREAAAAPAPWSAGRRGLHPWEVCIAWDRPLVEMEDTEQGRADAEFMAAARADIPKLLAEVERLRELVGDENQPGWDGCSRAEAIRQAESFHASVTEWKKAHDARRDERDEARAEVERLRGERAAMLRLIGNLVDTDDCWFDHHGGCQAHGYLSLEPGEKCPQQEAKELLEAANGGEQR